MHKLKELFSDHKAISVGLILVLVLIIGDAAIFGFNFTRKAINNSVTQEETKKEEAKQQEQQPQPTQPSQNTNNNNGGNQTPTCNQTAKNNFTAQYNAAVAAENARHAAQLARIQQNGELYPGYQQIATAQENALHNQNLTNLNNQLNANLRSVNC